MAGNHRIAGGVPPRLLCRAGLLAERLLVDADRALPRNSCWLADTVSPVWAARSRLPAALPVGAWALIRIFISRLC